MYQYSCKVYTNTWQPPIEQTHALILPDRRRIGDGPKPLFPSLTGDRHESPLAGRQAGYFILHADGMPAR